MVAAYERKYGHPPSKRTRWLMDQQAADKTRRPKAAARKIHGTSGGDADEAGRLAAWEAQTAAAEMTALSQVHTDVAAFGSRPVAVIDEDMKAMAARAAVAEVQQHHAVWSLSELRFEVGRALPPGASPELVREVADLAVDSRGRDRGAAGDRAGGHRRDAAGHAKGRDEHLPPAERGAVHDHGPGRP